MRLQPIACLIAYLISCALLAPAALAQKGGYHGPASGDGVVATDPVVVERAGVNAEAIESLRTMTERSGGSTVLIALDGDPVFYWEREPDTPPIELMSCTKSVVSLAVGMLLDSGKIGSLDQKVSEFLPAFTGGGRENLTVGMLLNHTSGLAGAFATRDIYSADDIVEFAVNSEIELEPGASFRYNNNAVNLLAAVVGAAAGVPADEFVAAEMFAPLGIEDWAWFRDPAGNPHGMAGCKLGAADLAKLGELMLARGVYDGQRIVSAEWIDLSVAPSQELYPRCGLLWWLVPGEPWEAYISADAIAALRADHNADADDDALTRAAALAGEARPLETTEADLNEALGEHAEAIMALARERGVRLIRRRAGPVAGYNANGYLGQVLMVLPDSGLVVVRQQASGGEEPSEPLNMAAFVDLARSITN